MKRYRLIVLVSLVLVCVVSFAAAAYAEAYSWRYGDNTLKRGHTGTYVKNAQIDLNSGQHSYFLDTDGIFGSMTEKATKVFQGNHGLSVDGQIGKNTKTALYNYY